MKIRDLIIGLLFWPLMFGAVLAEDLSGTKFDEAIGFLSKTIQNLPPSEGRFSQLSGNGEISEGQFWLYRPESLYFQYDEPSSLVLVASKGAVGVVNSKLKTVERYSLKQTPLYFLLSNEVNFKRDLKFESIKFENGIYIFKILDKKKETQGNLQIFIGADGVLKSWIITDAQKRSTKVSLFNIHNSKRGPPNGFGVPYPQNKRPGKN